MVAKDLVSINYLIASVWVQRDLIIVGLGCSLAEKSACLVYFQAVLSTRLLTGIWMAFILLRISFRRMLTRAVVFYCFCRCNKITDFCIIYDKVCCVGFGFVYQRWIFLSVIIPKFNIFSISSYPNNIFSKQVPLI